MRLLFLFCVASALAADPSAGRKLVFSDDFTGDKLDESKWGVSGSRDVISIVKGGKDSVLRIGLRVSQDMIQANAVGTRGKFSQQYGYFEASMKLGSAEGHYGSFRIISDDEKTLPNITLTLGSPGKDRVTPWAHAVLESGQQDFHPEKPLPSLRPGEVSKKFHTYGILWTEKSFTYYLDGKALHKIERKEFNQPMYVMFHHRISEDDRARLNLKSLPDDMDIDWVKVWK